MNHPGDDDFWDLPTTPRPLTTGGDRELISEVPSPNFERADARDEAPLLRFEEPGSGTIAAASQPQFDEWAFQGARRARPGNGRMLSLVLLALAVGVGIFAVSRITGPRTHPDRSRAQGPVLPSTTIAPTPEQVARSTMSGNHVFELEAVRCAGLHACPRRSRQAIAVSCDPRTCSIVNSAGGVWEGHSIPLVQSSDPWRFSATVAMVAASGFSCGGHPVDTIVLLDLRVSAPTESREGSGRYPIAGSLTERVAQREAACGSVAPMIQWRATAHSS